MPEILRRDDDGNAIYAEPNAEPEWDVNGDPDRMGTKALCAATARDILGCEIKWWGYYCDWVCGCDNMAHAYDSQCSALASPLELYQPVIDACDKRGIALLAEPPEALLRSALDAWRAAR